ncbi:hypothetical protein Zmor_001701 [Zophobas morio]|uniref:SANT domain-containing protein n=1 Tax=Zophobas morio TaxID=2755281 RepID=A0AA38MT48_9CUCU|nr:hypothetical protein Zmor_001701 [Zophobas morio]
MASRRTRIKGIANIPQRRKTINNPSNTEENTKLSPDFGHTNDEDPNLNRQHEIVGDKQSEECPADGKELQNELDKNEEVEKTNENSNEKGVETPTTPIISPPTNSPPEMLKEKKLESPDLNSVTRFSENYNDPIKIVSENTPEIVENTQNTKFETKPAVPVRRKFIKPAISVNAINRKTKESEEAKSITNNNPVNVRSGKVVILNEIITCPNQNQHVVIKSDHQVVGNGVYESQNHLLKPPEVTSVRPPNLIERDIKRLVPSSPQLLSPDIEYPIPPPSPNKINRSRIKAVPRLGQRNTSFSASESEDESRRNYRHRNDSVCSSTSVQDTNSIPECFSPQKPKEFNSVIQRKCRRTEQSRKLAEARRDFYLKFGNKKPDRQKLTMIDLIFYNPVTNPMSNENKSKRKNSEAESENGIQEATIEEESVDDPGKTGSDEENEMPAPQIKIGPQGELVLDEKSLLIENKAVQKSREEIEKSQVVNGDFETGYGVYKRAKRSKDWSKQETLKFYKALNTLGTDFTLMCELFPRRSRRELKMKFKKEERINKALVDKAIMQPCGFDFHDFKHEVDMEEKELQELEKQKEREKIMKQEAKKRKTALPPKDQPPEKIARVEKPKVKKKRALDIMNVLEDDSDADESEVESVEDDRTEDLLLETIQKPTRSGRVPKRLERYKAPEPENRSLKTKPGSLLVVASTGPNGPVYKVCMVTEENSRQQIGHDMNSLEKALECKEHGITNLFTLSATTTELEQNVTIPAEENNITIPAEENVVLAEENDITIPVGEETCTPK